MQIAITQDSLSYVQGAEFKRYAKRYTEIEQNAVRTIEQHGLLFERSRELAQRSEALKLKLRSLNVDVGNNGKSYSINWLSSACLACRKGSGSYTSFLSLQCHRDCYFCFNPNQEHYDFFLDNQRDALAELKEIIKSETPLTHAALTGGEPLLFKEQTIAFFSYLHEQRPQVHSRLYTAGDPLDKRTLLALKESGLEEIRFSIKIDDEPSRIEKVLHRIQQAKALLPSVMVEMPVISGTQAQMEQLLLRLDEIGIDGINLLEFCFPFSQKAEFEKRGFKLKYPPYETYYNYWYAGGLAIAESEWLCLHLIDFALAHHLHLGVHYCSLENKHTGQIYQQNITYSAGELYYFSERDYFFKSAKVFGEKGEAVADELKAQQRPYQYNLLYDYVQFHPADIAYLKAEHGEICLSAYVTEQLEDGDVALREVKLARTTADDFCLAAC